MGKCSTCNFWNEGHNGVYESDFHGTCTLLTNEANKVITLNDIIPLCEGCVNVTDRVSGFEFVTGQNFGCVRYKKR